MDTRPVPPASVTVASILSILGSGGMLIVGALFAVGARAAQSANDATMTPHARMILRVTADSLMIIGVLGILNGVSLLALQNWARKTMVIVSGFAVILSTYCLYISLALLGMPPEADMKPHASHVLWGSFFGISILIFGVSLWFVTAFTRPATLASFVRPLPPGDLAKRSAPSCPLPLALLAGFFIVGAVVSLLLLRASDHMPDMLFGHALYGTQRVQYVVITEVFSLVAAIGLLRVRTWGIHLAMGLQLFSVANHAATALNPKSLPSLRAALAAMAAQGAKPPLHDPAAGFHYLEGLGLSFALALLLVLLLSRSKFLEAASAPQPLP
ncbi:MAG TPA: hypothetical protein VJN89_01395 [Candidatus Acidoferrum sp.]|nr:hypothetical protein [Candidatus Acidoferrum sp.]